MTSCLRQWPRTTTPCCCSKGVVTPQGLPPLARTAALAAATTGSAGRGRARAAPNGRILEQLDREPRSRTRSCAAAMSIDRAGLRQQTASTRPAARWQSESASEPITRRRSATPRIAGRGSRDRVGRRPLEREDLDPVLRAGRVERRPVERRAAAALGDPLLTGAEVVDVPERTSSIVGPSATASESEKNGIARLALTDPSIGSTTTPGGPPAPKARTPSSSETSVRSAPSASSRARRRPPPPRRWRSCRPRPRRRAGPARARRASATRRGRRPRSATHARQNASQSITDRRDGRAGRRRASGRSRSSSAASPRRGVRASKTSSIRVGRRRNAQSASPDSTRRSASTPVGRVRDPVVPEPIDELDVELARRAADEPRRVRSHADRSGTIGTARARARRARPRRSANAPRRGRCPARPVKTRCVGKISRPGSDVETSTTSIRSAPLSSANATAVS